MLDHPRAPVAEGVFEQLNEFRQFGALKKAALVTMAFSLSQNEIKSMRAAFEQIDTANNGYITLKELQAALPKPDDSMQQARINEIFNGIDQVRPLRLTMLN